MLTRNGNSVYEAWTERLSSNVVVERETIIGGRLSDMCGMMGPYMASSLGLLIPGCPLVLVAVSTLGWLGSVIMVDCDFVEVDQWNLHQSSRCFEGMCLHMERFIVYTPDHHSVKIFSHWWKLVIYTLMYFLPPQCKNISLFNFYLPGLYVMFLSKCVNYNLLWIFYILCFSPHSCRSSKSSKSSNQNKNTLHLTWAKVALRVANPKQALKRTQKKYISEQRKYKYFTS